MLEKKQKVVIDIQQPDRYIPEMHFKQNDKNVYLVEIEVLNGGSPLDLKDISAIIWVNETPQSRTVIAGECEVDVEKGIAIRNFGSNELAEFGDAKAEIKLLTKDGVLSSTTFSYKIEKTIFVDDAIESTEEYGVLNSLIRKVNEIISDIKEKLESGFFKGDKGEVGPPGPKGEPGKQGIQGEPGKSYLPSEIKEMAGTRLWISQEYQPVLNTSTIVSHGLSLTNLLNCKWDVLLVCAVAEHGYLKGEFAINWALSALGSSVWISQPPIPTLTSQAIQLSTSNDTIILHSKTNGERKIATLANWRYVFRIWY